MLALAFGYVLGASASIIRQRLFDYNNKQLLEDIVPLYRKMRDHFSTNMWLPLCTRITSTVSKWISRCVGAMSRNEPSSDELSSVTLSMNFARKQIVRLGRESRNGAGCRSHENA